MSTAPATRGRDELALVASHLRVSSLRSVVAVVQEVLVVLTCAAAAELSASPAVYALAVIVIGSRLRALNNLVHDASHNLLSRLHGINRALGVTCALPTMLSLREYKRSHLQHHARLGRADDPDLVRLRQLGLHPLPTRPDPKALLLGLPLFYARYVLGSLYLGDRFSLVRRVGALGLILAGLSAAVDASFLHFALAYWLVPFFTSYQLIKCIAETGEHAGLYDRVDASSDIRLRSIHMTRNTLVGPVIAYFLYPHGDNFHMLHHRFPSVPGPHLASLHARLAHDDWYGKVGYRGNSPLWGQGSLLAQMRR